MQVSEILFDCLLCPYKLQQTTKQDYKNNETVGNKIKLIKQRKKGRD
jgi:hypothetical protein